MMLSEHLPKLSIIIAAKNPPEPLFLSCLWSISSLKNASKINLIIVSGGHLPEIPKKIIELVYGLKIVNQEPKGVYSAFNRGLEEVVGAYVMFLGVDDLILPGLDEVITSIKTNNNHMIACCTLMQNLGISRPSKFRWGLIFRNWCQQGLIYNASVFNGIKFSEKYKIQADHDLNMMISSMQSSKIVYRKEIISHFSSSGISQTQRDWVFRRDMPKLVRKYYGDFFWVIAVMKRSIATIIKGYKTFERDEKY